MHVSIEEACAHRCIHGLVGTCLHTDAYTARLGRAHRDTYMARLGYVRTDAYMARFRDMRVHGHVYGSVGIHARTVWSQSMAWSGCVRITHGLNFMDDWIMWSHYTNNHMQLKMEVIHLKVKAMQLKMEAMQLKVKSKHLKMEVMQLKVEACKATSEAMIKQRTRYMFHSLFSLVFFLSFFLSHSWENNILYSYQNLLIWWLNPKNDLSFSSLTCCNKILIL